MIKTTLLAAVLVSLPLTLAHGHIRSFCVGSNCYNGFNPSYEPEWTDNNPIFPTDNGQGFADWTQPIIASGGMRTGIGRPRAKGKAGDKVSFVNSPWPENHHGPIMEYMAHCPSPCDDVAASSLDWFKVHEETYNPSTRRWPTQDINEANGYYYEFHLPTDLPGGTYLLRHELLALHLLENGNPSPQFYPIAFALELDSQGTAVPTPTGRFPDMYIRDNMAVTHNIYVADNSKFVPPGVRAYTAGSESAPALATSAAANAASNDDVQPSPAPAPAPASAPSSADVALAPVAPKTCRMKKRRRSIRRSAVTA